MSIPEGLQGNLWLLVGIVLSALIVAAINKFRWPQ